MKVQEKVVYTPCQGSGCHEYCLLTTHVADGRIVYSERTVFPEPEGDWSGICQKGIAAGKLPYASDRVLHPLKRVGKKGEGKFERISWNQALDEIGAKLNEIREQYGPESVGVFAFVCGMVPISGLYSPMLMRFLNTFGATWLADARVDTGSFFSGIIDFGSSWDYANRDKRPIRNSKYIIIWGAEPISTRAGSSVRFLMEAQENGAKIVRIGLDYDPTSAKADEFIHVKPGTDLALALAMANLIIEEEHYDQAFLSKYTVAPFLVREDNGKFLREADIKEGGSTESYIIWNRATGRPVAVPPHTFAYSHGVEPDLKANVAIKGVACKTAFLKIKEQLSGWTPESQESITGVPGEVVRRITHEYLSTKPSTIWYDWGGFGRYYNGQRACRAVDLIAALTGNVTDCGLITSTLFCGSPVPTNDAEMMFPDGLEGAKGKYLLASEWTQAVETNQPYPIKAILKVAGNPVHAFPDRKVWEDAFGKVDLFVDYEIRMTDTTMWADYVLPDLTVYEKYDLINPAIFNHIILQEPAIDPIGEGKPPEVFWREIAKRVGLESYFDKSVEEWIDLYLKSTAPEVSGVLQNYQWINPGTDALPGDVPAIKDAQQPVTFERLKKEKAIRANVPKEPYNAFNALDFKTPSGRIAIYCEELADLGEAVAKYVDPLIRGPQSKKYPLQYYTGRSRFFMQTQFHEIKELATLSGGEPTLRINPKDAEERGIKDGDIVRVYNQRGVVKVKAKLSEALPLGTVHMWFGWRKQDYIEGAHNILLSPHFSPEFDNDPLRQRWEEIAVGKYPYLPKFANMEALVAMGWDIFWDNSCQVEKSIMEVAK
jgi:molybdopterin-containing oxidoreductase family molybdopterin binding subunit